MVGRLFRSFAAQAVLISLVGFGVGYSLHLLLPAASGVEMCHTIDDVNDEIRDGYGSPFNFFSELRESMIQIVCDNNDVYVRLGDYGRNAYIYKYAYERVDGEWKKIVLEGDDAVGPWFKGDAMAKISRSDRELAKTNRIVAYMCQKVDGRWQCGCRDEECKKSYWQIQEFTLQSDTDISDDAGDTLYAASVSKHQGEPGTSVTVTGNGFSSRGNTVYLEANSSFTNPNSFVDDPETLSPNEDARVISSIDSSSGTSLTFTVPADLAPGGYRVWVENADGEKTVGSEFRVTDPTASAPSITSIEPTSGTYGTEVTIYGSGFSTESNDILLTYGVVRGVASPDGTTLTVKIEPFSDELSYATVARADFDDGRSLPFQIMVANSGGVSKEQYEFSLTFE